MAIFKFYQIYRSIKEELGENMALKLFPEYLTLQDKMSPQKQAELGRILMDRMDASLDKETIAKVRQKHCCNTPKKDIAVIKELKSKVNNLDELWEEYSKFLSPGYVKKESNLLTVSFGWGKCVCAMFRKLNAYEIVSKSWCECCNGNVIKTYSLICDKIVQSEIVETVASGGKDCIFKVRV